MSPRTRYEERSLSRIERKKKITPARSWVETEVMKVDRPQKMGEGGARG
jgi:hypothetical protein